MAAPGGAETEKALVELGYAVAGSQYKTDGWAVGDGIADTEALTKYFIDEIAVPDRSILWGFSMGSIVTAHLAENSTYYDGASQRVSLAQGAPRAFDVGLALPIAYAAAFGWPEAWGTVGDLRDDLDFETEVLPVIGSQLFANPLDPSAGLNPDNLRQVDLCPSGERGTGRGLLHRLAVHRYVFRNRGPSRVGTARRRSSSIQ